MSADQLVQANNKLIRRLLLVVVGMFGFGFAMVPLYDVFCDITGINGKTGGAVDAQAAHLQTVDKDRLVTVEFVSAVNTGLPWEFRPLVNKIEVHPGEMNEVLFVARNRSEETVIGQAIPSVAPGLAALHFNKIECFCFSQQTLGPREEKEMPVRFVIDRGLPKDIANVTLSYTFFTSSEEKKIKPRNVFGLPPITEHKPDEPQVNL